MLTGTSSKAELLMVAQSKIGRLMLTAHAQDDENDNVRWAEADVREAERVVAQQLALLHELEERGYPEAEKARELLAVLTESLQLKREYLLREVARREQRRRQSESRRTTSQAKGGG